MKGFGIFVVLFASSVFAAWAQLPVADSVLSLHSFRFIGLAFLVPGVVSPDLPSAFTHSAAYGDIIAAILALLALILLPSTSALSQHGSSISRVQPISSMLSTRPITPGSWRDSWVPPISFRLSSCPYC